MHGFCGILGSETTLLNKKSFIKSINLANTMQVDSVKSKNFFSAVSFLETSPIKGARIYCNDNLIILFAGDLIGYKEIPWKDVETNFLNSNIGWFSNLRGVFAFAIYDKSLNKISLFSDQRAQLSVYYSFFNETFVFSTDLSTFTTLINVPDFNIKWLYEYLFFYFPVDRTTFFKGVYRLRHSKVLSFDFISKSFNENKYSKRLKVEGIILKGKKARKNFIKLFEKRVPKYFNNKGNNLVAISAGFDSRNILSLAPEKYNVQTYTYGVRDCPDLNGVSKLMKKLEIKHDEVIFENEFEKLLPSLIYDVVMLSGGVQPILRATILYVYKDLYNKGNDSIILGGISGDFYRGILYDPSGTFISPGVNNFFNNKDFSKDIDEFKIAFQDSYVNYKNHIHKTILKLTNLLGEPGSAELFMNYKSYVSIPHSFGGEVAIASNYFTFRQPFWDIDLLKMAYKTEYSYIGLLERYRQGNDVTYNKYVFQSKMIYNNPKFKKTEIKGVPIALFAKDNKILFELGRLFFRSLAYLKGFKKAKKPLEDWEIWFDTTLKDEFDKLLNENSLLLKYVSKEFMLSVKNTGNIHIKGKLVTTEIILRLIKDRWNIK